MNEREARLAIRKILATEDRTANINVFVDLCVLTLAIDAFKDAGGDPEHIDHGIALIRRGANILSDGMHQYITPLGDRNDAGVLRSLIHRAENGSIQVQTKNRADLFLRLFPWLNTRGSLFQDVFPGRATRPARMIAMAAAEDAPAARLRALTAIPSCGAGGVANRRWMEKAANLVGVGLPATQAVQADAETVATTAKELGRVQRAIEVADPMSEEAADLQSERDNLVDQIEEVAESSVDSNVVRATASATASEAASSRIARRFGLTPEQEQVVLTRGKVVVAAGAGSGKTATLVATITHLVEEEGLNPGQILACSFTRAAAAELGSRVEKAGIRGVEIGTTHKVARDIIIRNRPHLAQIVRKTKEADRLFKMAVAQVEMSLAKQQEAQAAAAAMMEQIESINGWAANDMLSSFHAQLSRGKTLSDKQIAVLNRAVGQRRWAAAPPKKAPGSSPYWKTPVGEWFNIGSKILDNDGKPMSVKSAKLLVENFKNNRVSVEAARTAEGDHPVVALYGAYEWLKRNDTVDGPAMDYQDQLIVALEILESDPAALDREQRRWKAVSVDEAQDLNEVQFKMFRMLGDKADTLSFIGDDKQCVDVTALVSTPDGKVPAGRLRAGDKVLSYRNGEVVQQTVRHVVPSQWTEGFRVTTEAGHSLLMSPNHRLWATEPTTEEGQVAVYLMYRPDMGFRVGITNKGKSGADDYFASYGGRAFLEKAERLWILDRCEDREAALLQEARYSLKYGIPMSVFNGEHRDINQDRLNSLFAEFGKNGGRLLEAKHLSFEHPHWMSQSYTKHGRGRHTCTLLAHSSYNTQVMMEWEGDKFDTLLMGKGVKDAPGDRRRLRRYFKNYRDALGFAEEVTRLTGANLSQKISLPEGPLREITASALFVGMSVPVFNGDVESGIVLDRIVSIESVAGEFVDLDVDDASNFIAGGILTHNSIYAFRGAKPQNYVNLSKDPLFKTRLMTANFRSGSAIVDAANQLIAHNGDRQIPMTCRAIEKRGAGSIVARDAEDHESAASQVAQEIKDAIAAGGSPKDFGILVRNNAEADMYTLALLTRGIPYRMLKQSEGGYFGRPVVRSMVGWMQLAVGGSPAETNEAVLSAHMSPGFGLDKVFASNLAQKARGPYADYILKGGTVYEGPSEWMNKKVAEYAAAIRKVRSAGAEDSLSLITEILSLKGMKGSFEDSLMAMVDEDDLEELGPDATDEMKKAVAMAPLRPMELMAKHFGDPANLLRFVEKMKRTNEKTQKRTPNDKEDWAEPAVLIGTVHGWKGLQAKHCYVSMAGGIFPNFRSASVADEQEAAGEPVTAYDEERRLAYVAITRGEDTVTVISPKKNYLGKPASRSRFLDEACIKVPGSAPVPEIDAGKTASVITADDEDHVLSRGEF